MGDVPAEPTESTGLPSRPSTSRYTTGQAAPQPPWPGVRKREAQDVVFSTLSGAFAIEGSVNQGTVWHIAPKPAYSQVSSTPPIGHRSDVAIDRCGPQADVTSFNLASQNTQHVVSDLDLACGEWLQTDATGSEPSWHIPQQGSSMIAQQKSSITTSQSHSQSQAYAPELLTSAEIAPGRPERHLSLQRPAEGQTWASDNDGAHGDSLRSDEANCLAAIESFECFASGMDVDWTAPHSVAETVDWMSGSFAIGYSSSSEAGETMPIDQNVLRAHSFEHLCTNSSPSNLMQAPASPMPATIPSIGETASKSTSAIESMGSATSHAESLNPSSSSAASSLGRTMAQGRAQGSRLALSLSSRHTPPRSSGEAKSAAHHSVDLANIQQVYSASSKSRSRMSETSVNVDAASATAQRRRAGTTGTVGCSDIACLGDKSAEAGLRSASSMADIEEQSSLRTIEEHTHHQVPLPSQDALQIDRQDIDWNRTDFGGLPANITAHFDSLGLEFERLSDVPQASIREFMFGDANSTNMSRTSTDDRNRNLSSGAWEQSFASSSSSALEVSSFEDSLLAPGTALTPKWPASFRLSSSHSGSQYTPLSSPAHSTQVLLRRSPSDNLSMMSMKGAEAQDSQCSRFDTSASKTEAPLSRPSPALIQSSSWSTFQPGIQGVYSSMSRRAVVGSDSWQQFPDYQQKVECLPAHIHPSKSAGELARAAALPSSIAPAGPPRRALRGRPMSLDGSTAAARSRWASGLPSGLVSPDQRKGKRVDYSEVSAALETVRAFLRQKEAGQSSSQKSRRGDHSSTSLSSASDVAEHFARPPPRTLRHIDGSLPPRGSVRLEVSASHRTSTARNRQPLAHHRQSSTFIASNAELRREQERLEAIQHLSERVKALRQQSMQYKELSERDEDAHYEAQDGERVIQDQAMAENQDQALP